MSNCNLLRENDAESLKVVRHSAAHVMATAVLNLFPETKLGHGPATDSGFFYDFYRPTPFTPDDMKAIEDGDGRGGRSAMRCSSANTKIAMRRCRLLTRLDDFMKAHFVERFTKPGELISLYRNGKFVDFCRGPHVPSTGRVKAFKLTTLAGAYWLGDEKNPQLQRIHGTAFFSQKEIWMRTLRGSKSWPSAIIALLGKQLDLFSIQELAGSGLIFWHPKGGIIRKIMEDWMREECIRRGYSYGLHAARDAAGAVERSADTRATTRKTCTRRWSSTTPSTG